MLSIVPENSVLSILLSDLLPAILTIVLGGLLAAIAFPRLQYRFDVVKQNNQRKRDLSEEIVRGFEKYVSDWRRLITIANYSLDQKLSKEEELRRSKFIESRNESRDGLLGSLRSGKLYFSSKTCCTIEKFLKWDEAQSSLTLERLPPVEEWRKWQEEITDLLSNELQ